ncbi:protein of unknown function [Nitrosospira sp. Nsp14]|uniref:DUF3883 domain-containing protein n=1 Tax=Nitrosospira sp. Nsp14 TaxID=1855333 RepID=UPI0008E77FF2|nr:DUF3883 domain-containing protein [Nitrosospira sp. Nsp14]SFH58841.1 protein of unknown function [Nitrosospira sp. Nsp14]
METNIEKGPTGRIRGLRELLNGVTRQDVLDVLAVFKPETIASYGFMDSTEFDLVHEGKAYPPKAILGLATKRAIGRELTSDEFTGGEHSSCFRVLKALRFEIRKKNKGVADCYVPKGLSRYRQYGREEISQLFEPGLKCKEGAVIETPKGSGNFIFMITLGEPYQDKSYKHTISEDGFLEWEFRTHLHGSVVIQKLLNHRPHENNIRLFLRSNAVSQYFYLGLLQYFSHDADPMGRVRFIWSIRSWDLNGEDLERMGLPYRAPIDPTYSPFNTDVTGKTLLKTDPPNSQLTTRSKFQKVASPKTKGSIIDWTTQDEKNRHLGLAGEKLVLQYEINMLNAAKREDLADEVKHVALYDASAGFDILSFQPDGARKRIEVKTTQGPRSTPFFISLNEVLASREDQNSYWIYRLFHFCSPGDQVSFYLLNGDVEKCCDLLATNFRASPTNKQST